MKRRVTGILQELNIPPHVRGYEYLREAILLCIANPENVYQITKTVYPAIAKQHDTTGTRVERATRHAIEIAYEPKGYARYFRQHERKPTNGYFIATIADLLRLEQEEARGA